MAKFRRPSRVGRLFLALAVGGAVFGIAAAVQASIPDANGVIHGCYNTSLAHGNPTGALRVIDTAKVNGNCASWEAPLNWNQRGVTGPTGATGATGPTGPTGAAGPGQTAPFAATLFSPTGSSHYWLGYGGADLNDGYISNVPDGSPINWLGPMSAAGTTGNLRVDMLGNHPGVGNSFQFRITVNGNDTPVTCTIADLQTSCSDTTDTASYAAGQYLGITFTAPTNVSPINPFVVASLSAG